MGEVRRSLQRSWVRGAEAQRMRTSDWNGGSGPFLSAFCVPGAERGAELGTGPLLTLVRYCDPLRFTWGN